MVAAAAKVATWELDLNTPAEPLLLKLTALLKTVSDSASTLADRAAPQGRRRRVSRRAQQHRTTCYMHPLTIEAAVHPCTLATSMLVLYSRLGASGRSQ